jgi:O-antigen/teichoic acid export membrane protein
MPDGDDLMASEAQIQKGSSVAARSRILRVIGRFGWGFGDQLLSSFTNFVLGLLVARTVGPRELGVFSLAYATFALSLGAVRAVAGSVLVVRHTAVSPSEWRHGVRGSAGTALVAGVVVGTGCLLVGAVAGGPLRPVLSILGVFLPALLVQDVWRFAFFARAKGSGAFLNDLAWAVVMFVALAALRETDRSSVAWFTFAWAGAGCVAALLGVLQLRVLPSGPVEAFRWLRQNRDLAPRFLAEFGVTSAASTLFLFGVGSLAGLAELGRLRAGQIAFGPLNVLFGGVGLVATPEGVRWLRRSPERLARGMRWLSLALASAPLVLGAVLLSLPRDVGEFLLGTNWEAARSLVLPLSIGTAGFGATFGAYTGLRALAAAKRSLRARSVDALTTLCFALAGAAAGGARGAAWGLAVGACLENLIAWWQFRKALGDYANALGGQRRLDPQGEEPEGSGGDSAPHHP